MANINQGQQAMKVKEALREAGASVGRIVNQYRIHVVYVGYNHHNFFLAIAPSTKLAEFRKQFEGDLIEAYTPEDALRIIGAIE